MKKFISLFLVLTLMFSALALIAGAEGEEAAVPLMQPEPGDFELQLYGRSNTFVQQAKFTDNGDGTFGVYSAYGDGTLRSFTENYVDGQFTNQNGMVGDTNVTWNNYFPLVYYKDGMKADELHWGLEYAPTDFSDVLDMEVWYSDDSVSWRKVENVTIVKYAPSTAGPDYTQEFDQNCGSGIGVRFIFAEPVEANFFFAYDPDPMYGNVKHWSPFFCAAVKASAAVTEPTPASSAVETDPTPIGTSAKGTDKPVDTTTKSPDESAKNNTGLIIGIVAAVVVVAAIVAVVIVKSKKK